MTAHGTGGRRWAAAARALGSARARALGAPGSMGLQALATSLDESLAVAAGPHTERELRAALEAHPDAAVRERGLAALDRLEAARDAVAAASPDALRDALAALDATFTEVTGETAFRNPGQAYGARTLSYVDCMRDLDVTIGPGLVAPLAPALHVLFEAGRWYCGEVNAVGSGIVRTRCRTVGRDRSSMSSGGCFRR